MLSITLVTVAVQTALDAISTKAVDGLLRMY